MDLRTLVHEHSANLPKTHRALVVANLPYYITTPILNKLLSDSGLFSAFTLMVQLEVAQKLTASPGSRGYSELSVKAQYFTEPVLLFEVPPTAFDPPPAVAPLWLGCEFVRSLQLMQTRTSCSPSWARVWSAPENAQKCTASIAFVCGEEGCCSRSAFMRFNRWRKTGRDPFSGGVRGDSACTRDIRQVKIIEIFRQPNQGASHIR